MFRTLDIECLQDFRHNSNPASLIALTRMKDRKVAQRRLLTTIPTHLDELAEHSRLRGRIDWVGKHLSLLLGAKES